MQEWQIDEQGKKYRMVGNIKEYMPTVIIDGIEIENTPEALSAFHESRRAALEEQRKKDQQRQQEEQTSRLCPLDRFSNFPKYCKTICALYGAQGCALKRLEAVKDTKGSPCPFMRSCTPLCALYDKGCTM